MALAWGPDAPIYVFLFLATYFESFLLITFLSAPARAGRERTPSKTTPKVSVIVPCYNEESTVAGTAESLLALEYPTDKLSVVLVDDGSTDGTPQAMAQFRNHPQVTIIRKENGGKHSALNAGLAATGNADIVGCLDADSFVAPDALCEMLSCFEHPDVAAATASMAVHEPKTLLQRMQYAEYLFGITMRHILASINSQYVTPGPFSLYRASIFEELGGFRHGHQTEDMEMALRIQRAHKVIENAPRARVFTKAPSTLGALIKQRTRWTSGFIRNVLYDYRDLVGNRRYDALGLFVLPFSLFAVVSGIVVFFIAVGQTAWNTAYALYVADGVPWSYTFSMHPFSWFYLPVTNITLLTIFVLGITLSLTIAGKYLSRLPGKLTPHLIPYVLFYGFISPLWIIRAVADTATGTRRNWK